MNLQKLDLEDFLPIKAEAFLYHVTTADTTTILILKFFGIYRSGSMGSPDAQTMNAIKQAAVQEYWPNGLILDFSELEYRWGDDFDNLLPNETATYYLGRTPMAVVVGQQCREAIRTLTFGFNSTRELSETSWAKESLPDAIEFLEPRAIEHKRLAD